MSTDQEYVVKFERVGRNHSVADLHVPLILAPTLEALAEHIHDYARRHLMSSDTHATVVEDATGALHVLITAGFNNAGTGTVTKRYTPKETK